MEWISLAPPPSSHRCPAAPASPIIHRYYSPLNTPIHKIDMPPNRPSTRAFFNNSLKKSVAELLPFCVRSASALHPFQMLNS